MQVKSKPRTPPPVDESAERERAALGDKISQLQERMRQRKEELAKQKESEAQAAAAAGPSLSDLEKQKMEKMRQFIAQARDAKGIAPGQSALSSLPKPGLLSPLGGNAEGLYMFLLYVAAHSRHFSFVLVHTDCPVLYPIFTLKQVVGKSCCWTLFLPFVPSLIAPFAIDCEA